jgi:uncharacterized protein YjiS (DUF1127 family)
MILTPADRRLDGFDERIQEAATAATRPLRRSANNRGQWTTTAREFIHRLAEFRRLRRELASYSDLELADLGISRPLIMRIAVRGAFANEKPSRASADTSVGPGRANKPLSGGPLFASERKGA